MFSYSLLGLFICILGVSCCERPRRRRATPFMMGKVMAKPLILSQWSSTDESEEINEDSTEDEIYSNRNNLITSDTYESNV